MLQSVAIPISNFNGIGQATAVLLAGEQYSGVDGQVELKFIVKVCIVGGSCTDVPVVEKRTPVVLIHGALADNKTWDDVIIKGRGEIIKYKQGMKKRLIDKGYKVGLFSYNKGLGPSKTMMSVEGGLFRVIHTLCESEKMDGLACTRSDIIAHSMGGLVARKYIKDNEHYRGKRNFQQGSVRRLITLGTPYSGTGLANFLSGDNLKEVDWCLSPAETSSPDYRVLRLSMYLFGMDPDGSAAVDLSIGSKFLNELNSERQDVMTFAIVGDAPEFPFTAMLRIINYFCTDDQLFQSHLSDGFVSVNSAKGNGVVIDNVPFYFKQLPVGHVGMGANHHVIRETLSILQKPSNNFSPVIDGTKF